MGDFVTVLPSAGRLMGSLRDIGYDFTSAVADLVDNSIDARAHRVEITVNPDGPCSWVRVADDGVGMGGAEMDEAMRYGSRSDYAQRSLGHFGLGLKTASLSQCRRLTVASRRGPRGRITVRSWDLDEVQRRDSWDLQTIRPSDAPQSLVDALPASGGTVVLWENLDRVLPRRPTEGMTARVLRTVSDQLREHLEMVFHRFVSGEAYGGRTRLSVTIDGSALDAWDPFARDEPHTRALPTTQLEFGDDDDRLALEVKPYVLPAQHLFSSPEAHRRAGGPNRWNRHQGFYIYRRERLIQPGGWNRLRTLDEHAKLARIALELPAGREERFAVDVAKMRVTIPEDLRPQLRAIASGVVVEAQERYREHIEALSDAEPAPPPSREAISISRDWPAIMQAVDSVLQHDPDIRDKLLLKLANADPDALSEPEASMQQDWVSAPP